MKLTILSSFIAVLLSVGSCQYSVERMAEHLDESMELLGDAMEEFGDVMELYSDSLANDSAFNHGIRIVNYDKGRGGKPMIITINNATSPDGRSVRISNKDRYIDRIFHVENFNGINATHTFKVVMCDTMESVVVRINENLNKQLNVRLQYGCLMIGLDNVGSLKMEEDAICGYVYIPYRPKLESVELSGISTFQTSLPIRTTDFSLTLSGASLCQMQGGVVCNSLKVDLSGTSHCKSNFQFSTATVDMGGATHMDGTLRGRKADLDLNGTSVLKSTVSLTNIEADMNGSSKLRLSGKANKMEIDMSGTSNLDAQNLSVETIKGDMGGATKAHVNASKSIAIDVSGTGHLACSGSADISGCSASRMATIVRTK